MYFERLRLQQFKPYADAEVTLTPGVTVIHGLNGSGKSSLLEACFLSLYGSAALDDTLDAVMTTGADATVVELQLRHRGEPITIHRELRRRSSGVSTTTATLEGHHRQIEGTRDIRAHVRELLRMDVEAFRNCAYVRQGEINKLIEATPGERQRMIDTLLQLGRLEAYRDRARSAALAAADTITGIRGRIDELDAQIAPLEDVEPAVTIARIDSEIAATDERIGYYEEQRERAGEAAADASTVIAEYEADLTEHEAVTEAVTAAETTVRELQAQRDQLDAALTDQQEQLTAALADRDARFEELGMSALEELQRHRDWVAHASAIAEARREVAVQRQSTARAEHMQLATESRGQHSRAVELAERTDRLRTERDSIREAFTDVRSEQQTQLAHRQILRQLLSSAPTVVDGWTSEHDRLTEGSSRYERHQAALEVELSEAESDVAEAQALIEAGRCPTCAQPTDTIHAHANRGQLQQRAEIVRGELACVRRRLQDGAERVRIAAALSALTESLADADRDLSRVREQLTTERRRLEAQQQQLEAAQADERALADKQAALTARRPEVSAAVQAATVAVANAEALRAGVEQHRSLVEAAAAAERSHARVRDELTGTARERELVDDRLTDKREQLRQLRVEAEALSTRLDSATLEAAHENLAAAEEYLEQVDTQLMILQGERDQLTEGRGELVGIRERVRSLRDERTKRVATHDALAAVADEVRDLETLYETLREDLRSTHLQVLERLLNEMFQLVYGNDAYAGIDLDPTYAITVRQNDGTPLSPSQLSGGERAVFNLALRCAIYQLLAEGATGGTELPPLILDEPTVFLDRGHVRQLSALIDAMREIGVPQVLIVTHDEELIGAADQVIRVEKDPHSNRSVVADAGQPGSSAGM
jgi:exonuclease SbcC